MVARIIYWLAGFVCFVSGDCLADNIKVAVAANFQPTLAQLKQQFEQRSVHQITIISGSSGKLYAQILNGAPFDLFLSADKERPVLLEKNRLGVAGSRFTYAIGQLVLWSANQAIPIEKGEIFSAEGISEINKIAIANPKLAPYGAAAQAFLEKNHSPSLHDKLVTGENVAQTFHLLASGAAEIGFVSLAQLKTPGFVDQGASWLVPDSMYPPVIQQAITLKSSLATQAFVDFMKSEEGKNIISNSGYKLPDGIN